MAFLDTFKPKWKSSDMGVRKSAVHSLGPTDLDALLDIAKNDEDAEIRKLAVQKNIFTLAFERFA